MKTICFKVDIDIFDYEIWFFKGPVELFKKKFGKYDHDPDYKNNINTYDYSHVEGVTMRVENDRRIFIYIVNDDEDTIIHETNHAIQGMLDNLKIPMGIENEELVSTLHGYIQTRALKGFGKLKRNS